jgi:PAS domain S-box-containing protein
MCALPIGRFRSEVARLREQAETTESEPSTLRPALRRLAELVEELQAASEELEARNRQLALEVRTLERDRRRDRALAELGVEGSLVTDAAGRVLAVNRAATELAGRPEPALIGTDVHELFVEEERGAVRHLLSGDRDREPGRVLHLRGPAGAVSRVHARSRVIECGGQGEEPIVCWALADLERPLFLAEALGASDPVVARRWLAAYGELIALHERPSISWSAGSGPSWPAERRGSTASLEAQLARLRARLAYWQRRHADLSGIEFDRAAGQVRYRGRAVEVTRREAELLEFLLQHPGSFFPAQVLLHRAWHASYLSTEQLRSYVVRVRAKLAQLELPCQLVNRRARGYALLVPAGAPVPALHVVGDDHQAEV